MDPGFFIELFITTLISNIGGTLVEVCILIVGNDKAKT